MSAYADLDDARAGVIASGVIPDMYLIEPTGTYWNANGGTSYKAAVQEWLNVMDESVTPDRFSNKVNREMFNAEILLEGRVDSVHEVTALLVAKERAKSTYSESGYLKKYHDYIIGEHNPPSNVTKIDATLNSTLGDMLPLAGAIKTVTDRAASIGGVPTALWEQDPEYWFYIELETYCDIDAGMPGCTQPSDGVGAQGSSPVATLKWAAAGCVATVCEVVRSQGVSSTTTWPFGTAVTGAKVTGHSIYAIYVVNNAPPGTTMLLDVDMMGYGPSEPKETKPVSDTASSRGFAGGYGWWYGYYPSSTHPCYSDPDDIYFDQYRAGTLTITQCIQNHAYSFSGSVKLTFPSSGNGNGNGNGSTTTTCKAPVINDISDDTGYVGHKYTYDVIGNKGGLTYTVSISKHGNPDFTILDSDKKPAITTSGNNGELTWDIPDDKDGDENYIYIGTYDVTVTATGCSNPEKDDTQTFELTVRENNIPELNITATGGIGYNLDPADNLNPPDFDPDVATDAKYTRVMWRFAGTLPNLGDPIKYTFTGNDSDADDTDQTFILSVSEKPSIAHAVLTDCKPVSELTAYEVGSKIIDSMDSPFSGFACIFAFDTGDGEVQHDGQTYRFRQATDMFSVQLSDGVADPVSQVIKFSFVDLIGEVEESGVLIAKSIVDFGEAVTTRPGPLGLLAPLIKDVREFITEHFIEQVERAFIEIAFKVSYRVADNLDEYFTLIMRCEIDVPLPDTKYDCEELPSGVQELKDYLTKNDIIGGNDVSGQQSEERKPRWTLVANVSNTRHVAVNDTNIEPNKDYTYVARIIAGDKASDYMPLGNVTTPADEPPVILLNGSSIMTILLGTPYVEPGYMAIDYYDGNVTDDMTVSNSVDVNREGNYNIFYYASDSAGNLATPQKRIVFVIDDSTPPVLTLKGSKTISIDAGLTYTDPGYSAIDNKDGNITDNVVVTGTVNTRVPDVYTIQYDVSDRVGNKAPTQTRTVTIIGDDTPPVITLKGNKTITIEAGLTYVDPGYTATDNRDGNITDMVVITGTVDTNTPGTYTIQYDVLDSSSNVAIQQIRTVTVVDTIPPTLTLKGGSSITIPASVPYVDPGYTATDNTDGNVRVEIVGWVNTNRPGSYSLQYTAYDSSDNKAPPQIRMIIVEDVTPPVITLKGNSSITVPASIPYVDPGYTAIDNIDGDITGRVVISGMVDTDTLGDYTIYYDVSDGARNAAIQQSRTVTVVDMTPPVITLKGGSSITIPASVPYVEPGYTAIDNIDGNLTENVVITGHVDTDVPGTYTLYYDVWDAELNLSPVQNRTVIVVDMTPPVITLKGNSSITVPASIPYTDPGYTAIDNIDGDITGRVVIAGMVDTDTLGDYTIYYDVSDGARNAAIQQSRTVTVVDMTPPVITLTGNATITIPMGPTYTDPGYTATDNIDGDITSMVTVSGTVNPLIPGTYTIQYMVTDAADNTKQQDRVVTVSPPTDTTLYCNDMTLAQLMASGKYNIINKMFSSDSNIKGTDKADLIISGNNGPTIEGKGGDDCIIGGAGNDTILGQVGNDMMFGNGGNDEIRGGDNKDTIYGGSGNDELHGGSGHDTIHGEGGADEIHGGSGNDTIYGGSEGDTIWGLSGNDTIYGEGGDDTIYAGPGIDAIYGGPGTDTIESGETDTVHDDDE